MNKIPLKAIKIAMMGDSEVGKTCLIEKIHSGYFREYYSAISSTISYRIFFKDLPLSEHETKSFNLYLHDTMGNKKLKSKNEFKNCIRKSDAALILYDITNKESFNNVDEWAKYINAHNYEAKTYKIFLIGTKSDLVNEDGKKRQVQEIDAKEKCSLKKLEWAGEISSKEISQEELKEKFKGFLKIINENRWKTKRIEDCCYSCCS